MQVFFHKHLSYHFIISDFIICEYGTINANSTVNEYTLPKFFLEATLSPYQIRSGEREFLFANIHAMLLGGFGPLLSLFRGDYRHFGPF